MERLVFASCDTMAYKPYCINTAKVATKEGEPVKNMVTIEIDLGSS